MARIRTGDIKVDGLAELNKALKAIGPDARKDLKAASKKVAQFVAADAREAARAIPGRYGGRSVAAKTAPSIKPTASIGGASGVSMGGNSFPFAGGAEFGSLRAPQFEPWRGSGTDAGYFLYPAIRQDLDRITTEFVDAVDHIIKRRFPE